MRKSNRRKREGQRPTRSGSKNRFQRWGIGSRAWLVAEDGTVAKDCLKRAVLVDTELEDAEKIGVASGL